MSLAPAFEIGLWNAWIFTVLSLLTAHASVIPFLGNKKAMKRTTQAVPLSKIEKISALSTHALIIPVTVIYSVFLPLKPGTVWFYAGLVLCFLALVMRLIVNINVAATPLDEPVTKGVYRISRHPMYFSRFLLFIGIGIACASWIFLLCAVLWIVLWHIALPAEERFCLERYGDAYREYVNRTPKWLGMPKLGGKHLRL